MNIGTALWIDGKLVEAHSTDAHIHVLTHTLHYGYGVFEGIRAYRRADGTSHIFRLAHHINRLFSGAETLGISIPYSRQQVWSACIEVVDVNRLTAGYIRPVVFLGAEALGLGVRNNTVHVAIAAWPWSAYLGEDGVQKGIRCTISNVRRVHGARELAGVKACGMYVPNVLAKRDAMIRGFDEAIMLDEAGCVAEGTGENLFMVRDGVLYTPPMGRILAGITRRSVIDLAGDMNLRVEQVNFTPRHMVNAAEVFLTGTAAEITPVREIDGHVIGEGTPGPITRAIMDGFADETEGMGEKHPEWRTPYTLSGK